MLKKGLFLLFLISSFSINLTSMANGFGAGFATGGGGVLPAGGGYPYNVSFPGGGPFWGGGVNLNSLGGGGWGGFPAGYGWGNSGIYQPASPNMCGGASSCPGGALTGGFGGFYSPYVNY